MSGKLISFLVLFSALTFCLCDDTPNCVSSPPLPANLTKSGGKLSISGGIDSLKGKQSTCIWIITSNLANASSTHLMINKFSIADNENLTITDSTGVVFTLSGTKSAGFVLTGNTNVTVTLSLTNAAIDRDFEVRYSNQDSNDQITNIDRPGRITAYLAMKGNKQSFQLKLGVHNQLSERNLLLNSELFGLSGGSLTIENVQNVDSKTPFDKSKSPLYMLSNGSFVTLKFADLPLDGKSQFVLHYELVNSICSKYDNTVNYIQNGSWNVNLPDNKQLQTLERYKCFYIFELKDASGKFQFNFGEFKFTNPYDKLTISDGDFRNSSTVALVIPDNYQFLKPLPLFTTSNKISVYYECPQVISTTVSYNIGLSVSAIKQGGRITDGKLSVKKYDNPSLPFTFTFTAENGKQAVIKFSDNKTLPGKDGQHFMNVSNRLSTDRSPFAVLNSLTFPPSFMASDSNELRIEISSADDFNADLISQTEGCFATASGDSASYLLKGCDDICSWFIPRNDRNNGTLVLQFLHLNLSSSDSISIERFYTVQETVFTISGPLSTLAFPDLNLNAAYNYAINTKRECKTSNSDGIYSISMAYVKQSLDRHLIDMTKIETQTIQPMDYPYYYTLGTNHEWAVFANPKQQVLLTFSDLDLASNHTLNVQYNKTSIQFNRTNVLPSDYLVDSPFNLTLFSQSYDPSQQPFSGRGFNLTATAVDCGGTFAVDSKNNQSISANTNVSECIWIVSAAKEGNTFNVLQFTIDYKNDSNLTIYDSNSIRDANVFNFAYFNATNLRSSSKSIVIVYKPKVGAKTLTNLHINFTVSDCLKITNATICGNGQRCLLPQFRCNGINDCGDWTDEKFCNGTVAPPTPAPEPEVIRTGVNGWVVLFVICPLCIGLGVAFTIFGPPLMQRFRRGRYTEFQDFSEVS